MDATVQRAATEQDDRRAEPDELNQLKLHFLAGLNHEIRTPLTGILGMTDLLMETRLDPEQKGYVAAARTCAENLLEILNATLEFSAISAGNLIPEESEFDVCALIEAAVAEYLVKARAKGLRLLYFPDSALPVTAIGDAVRIRQILTHLLSNAVKFTHEGQIEVTATCRLLDANRTLLELRVADSGIGILEEKLGTIFESFRQLQSGLARSYSGLGLGLALAQKVAELIGGRIEVESTVGVGSTFTLTVPVRLPAVQSQAVEPDLPARTASEAVAGRARILLVEDNRLAQMVVRHILDRTGFHVDCADDGPSGIQAASAWRYDLILMDLQMPGMDGLEAARRIRALEGYSAVPILALTANSSDECRVLCRENGMQDFLSKPIQADQLLRAIARRLG